MQLWHTGRVARPRSVNIRYYKKWTGYASVSSSIRNCDTQDAILLCQLQHIRGVEEAAIARGLEIGELSRLKNDYARAARNAMRLDLMAWNCMQHMVI